MKQKSSIQIGCIFKPSSTHLIQNLVKSTRIFMTSILINSFSNFFLCVNPFYCPHFEFTVFIPSTNINIILNFSEEDAIPITIFASSHVFRPHEFDMCSYFPGFTSYAPLIIYVKDKMDRVRLKVLELFLTVTCFLWQCSNVNGSANKTAVSRITSFNINLSFQVK